jgi:hypothetical protein
MCVAIPFRLPIHPISFYVHELSWWTTCLSTAVTNDSLDFESLSVPCTIHILYALFIFIRRYESLSPFISVGISTSFLLSTFLAPSRKIRPLFPCTLLNTLILSSPLYISILFSLVILFSDIYYLPLLPIDDPFPHFWNARSLVVLGSVLFGLYFVSRIPRTGEERGGQTLRLLFNYLGLLDSPMLCKDCSGVLEEDGTAFGISLGFSYISFSWVAIMDS